MRMRRISHSLRTLAVLGVCTMTGWSALAQTPADNTKVNARDRAKGAQTADQQKDNAGDRNITRKIRRAVMDDKSLSTYAHNVKIITAHGRVTLKGPVRSLDEERAIEAKASDVVGSDHVVNHLSIARAKNKK